MRITLFLLIVVMVLPSCRHKAPADRITQFDWLEGEWVNDAEFPLITREIWPAPTWAWRYWFYGRKWRHHIF